jgi:[ribosomal protein S5]-alanine N-acetyltransferase
VTVRIETPRFLLRELSADDVSERYLSWFSDPDARANISAAAATKELDDLRRYVEERVGREDVLFLGIFDRKSGIHIGNVKYEPLDRARGYAIMGILVGDPAFRGKGVASEVLAASGRWLQQHRDIKEIVLGVDRSNAGAIRAYEKVGYRVARTPHIPVTGDRAVTMVWVL